MKGWRNNNSEQCRKCGRRNIVLSKLSKGYTQAEIAKELNIHPSTISLDVQYLREKARDELKTHLTEKLPWEHTKVMNGIQELLKKAHDILDKTSDPKMQLQTISVLTGLYNTVMSLATDAGVIEQSLKRLAVIQDKNEAIFSDKEVKEYYQREGESSVSEVEEEFPKEDEEPEPPEEEESGEQYDQ